MLDTRLAISIKGIFIFAFLFAYMPVNCFFYAMDSNIWNDKVKRLLKSEIVRRGITYEHLVGLLADIGVKETKASIDSKMSRGTFSAAFLVQCLIAIGCKSFCPEISPDLVEEPRSIYKAKKKADYEIREQ